MDRGIGPGPSRHLPQVMLLSEEDKRGVVAALRQIISESGRRPARALLSSSFIRAARSPSGSTYCRPRPCLCLPKEKVLLLIE